MADITRIEEGRIAHENGGAFSFGRLSQRITHADLTDADTSQAVALTGFPANAIPLCAYVELDTEFSGGTVSALTVAVGDAGDVDELLTATSVFTSAGAGVKHAAGAIVGKHQFESAYAPIATFTSTTDNLVNLDAGACWVHVTYALFPPKSP